MPSLPLHLAMEVVTDARGQEKDRDQSSDSLGFYLKDLNFSWR